MSFLKAGGFSSFLHERPSQTGSYRLSGQSLILQTSYGPDETMKVSFEAGCLRFTLKDESAVYCVLQDDCLRSGGG